MSGRPSPGPSTGQAAAPITLVYKVWAIPAGRASRQRCRATRAAAALALGSCHSVAMTTPLDKTLKRELSINGQLYTITLSPEGLMLTLKGRRKGLQLTWRDLVTGEAALAAGLNASLGELGEQAEKSG